MQRRRKVEAIDVGGGMSTPQPSSLRRWDVGLPEHLPKGSDGQTLALIFDYLASKNLRTTHTALQNEIAGCISSSTTGTGGEGKLGSAWTSDLEIHLQQVLESMGASQSTDAPNVNLALRKSEVATKLDNVISTLQSSPIFARFSDQIDSSGLTPPTSNKTHKWPSSV